MTFFYIIILGIVQGLTEFLPVSSSGHLVFLNQVFQIEANFMFLSVLLHVATLLAVLVALRKEVWQVVRHPTCEMSKKVIVSFLPTVLVVLLFKGFFESAFEGGKYLSITFSLTALLLLVCQFYGKPNKKNKHLPSYKTSALVGLCQGIAAVPGLSRSGTTISAAMLLGMERESAAKFSFLMSIPVIVASFAYDLIFNFGEIAIDASLIPATIISFVLSFLVGLWSVRFMVKGLSEKHYYKFSIYLVMLSVLNLFI